MFAFVLNISVADEVRVLKLEDDVDPIALADVLGAEYLGPLIELRNWHRFQFIDADVLSGGYTTHAFAVQDLTEVDGVVESVEEVERLFYPRTALSIPADPDYFQQWHLSNPGGDRARAGVDTGALQVWNQGVTGKGVRVAVVDSGIEYTHPDLLPNYLDGLDALSGGTNPLPVSQRDFHGTAVSGIILAARNGLYGVGVASDAQLRAVKLLDGDTGTLLTSSQTYKALMDPIAETEVYNNSWGQQKANSSGLLSYISTDALLDDAFAALENEGRQGKGAVVVWASGNEGNQGADANMDRYTNRPFTIAVGAVGIDGVGADYSENGAAILLVAPSQGAGRGILTTDPVGAAGASDGPMMETFGGTSAAAPMVTGVVALMLEANPDLGWRDVQVILSRTALQTDPDHEDWMRNAAGRPVNHQYGYGLVDAEGAVALARNWNPLPEPDRQRATNYFSVPGTEWQTNQSYEYNMHFEASAVHEVFSVEVEVRIEHPDWAELEIALVSPGGTRSILQQPFRSAGIPPDRRWIFSSVRHIGEASQGNWKVVITDRVAGNSGYIESLEVTLAGWPQGALNGGNHEPIENESIVKYVEHDWITIDLLEGVSDADGDVLTVLTHRGSRAGGWEHVAGSRYRYRMQGNRDGRDHIQCTISDNRGGTLQRVIRIESLLPVAAADQVVTLADTVVDIAVLENDFELQGLPLTLDLVENPRNGSAEIIDGSVVRFRSVPGYRGVDRFRYRVRSSNGRVSWGWISVFVEAAGFLAVELDGYNGHLRVDGGTGFSLQQALTLEAWILPTGWGEVSSGFGRIMDKGVFSWFLVNDAHEFYNQNSMVLYLVPDSGEVSAANSAAGSLVLNKWQHVAVSYTPDAVGTAVRMYVDGEEVAVTYQADVGGFPRGPLEENAQNALYIGESASGQRAFEGAMRDIRVWSINRTAGEIKGQYQTPLNGSENNLWLYFPLSEGSGNITALMGAQGQREARFMQGASWRPENVPWRMVEADFLTIRHSDNGWLYNPVYGWLFGDLSPWVYHETWGWFRYINGGGLSFWIYSADFADWALLDPVLYPWVWFIGADEWYYSGHAH